MIDTYRAEDVRAADAIAVAAAPPGALMRQAAYAVAREVLVRLPSPVPGRRAVLLIGTGNNGGDALFAGAYLRRRGVQVTALITDAQRVHQEGAAELSRRGGKLVSVSMAKFGLDRARQLISHADVVVDGLVGLMGRPPLRPLASELVGAANSSGALRVAIDIPSGMHPNTETQSAGEMFRADLVVTFGAVKTGVALGLMDADLVVEPLGMRLQVEPDAQVFTDADVQALIQPPGVTDNKFSQGVLGVIAGSQQYPGAAQLAVGAAVRLRPGLVRYVGPQLQSVLSMWPEVVGTKEFDDAGRVQAWVVGPGLGLTEEARTLLTRVLAFDGPVLVDADGLTLLSEDPHLLESRRGRPTVLTPHAGEFARLFPEIALDDRLRAVRAAAAQTGVTILLKGHRTLVAEGRQTSINRSGSAWLATAGSGDVLAGVIGSLLAHGVTPFQAAGAGAHLHGRAGERAQADRIAGARGLIDHLSQVY